jgi:hypothetical protein
MFPIAQTRPFVTFSLVDVKQFFHADFAPRPRWFPTKSKDIWAARILRVGGIMSTTAPSRRDTPASASSPEPTLRALKHENVAGLIGNTVSADRPTTDLALRSVLEQGLERLPPVKHPENIRFRNLRFLADARADLLGILQEHGTPQDAEEGIDLPAGKNREEEDGELVDDLLESACAELLNYHRSGWLLSRARQRLRDSHKRGWGLFAARFAQLKGGISVDTVDRCRKAYELEAKKAKPPLQVIKEAVARGIDLGEKRNRPVLAELRQMPPMFLAESPGAAVEQAIDTVRARRQKVASRNRLSTEDQRLNALRLTLRSILAKLRNKEDLDLLWRAMGVELYSIGFREVLRPIITPEPEEFTLSGEIVPADPQAESAEPNESRPSTPCQLVETTTARVDVGEGGSTTSRSQPQATEPEPLADQEAEAAFETGSADEARDYSAETKVLAEAKITYPSGQICAPAEVGTADWEKWTADFTTLNRGPVTPFRRKVIKIDSQEHLRTGLATFEQIKQYLAIFGGDEVESGRPSIMYRDLQALYPQFALPHQRDSEADVGRPKPPASADA